MRRTSIRDRRALYFAPGNQEQNSNTGEITQTAGTAVPFSAAVVPVSGQEARELYGIRSADVYRLHASSAALRRGDMVWLSAGTGGAPDYTVIRLIGHPQEPVYEIGKRGVFGG